LTNTEEKKINTYHIIVELENELQTITREFWYTAWSRNAALRNATLDIQQDYPHYRVLSMDIA
jgi:hypothetical protein